MIDILIFIFKYVPDLVVHSLVLFGFVGLFISSFAVSTFSNFGIKMISIFNITPIRKPTIILTKSSQ